MCDRAARYELGQVVRCVIIKADPHRKPAQLILSLDVAAATIGGDAGEVARNAEHSAATVGVSEGSIVSGTVVSQPTEGSAPIELTLEPSGASATLSLAHLGDHAALLGDEVRPELWTCDRHVTDMGRTCVHGGRKCDKTRLSTHLATHPIQP
jgi:hypothetical protein